MTPAPRRAGELVVRVVEVLGPGCRRCEHALAEVRAVAECIGSDAEIRHVTDPFEMVARGVLFSFPAVVIDGILVSSGRVPSRGEIERWLVRGPGGSVAPG